MENGNNKFFQEAKDVAKLSTFYKCHTGCVIVYKNRIISSGCNSTKTHPLQRKYNKERFDDDNTPHYMHAEVQALTNLINDDSIKWKKVHIYNYRISKNKYAISRPCASCMALIKHLGIHHLHYTTNDGFTYEFLDY